MVDHSLVIRSAIVAIQTNSPKPLESKVVDATLINFVSFCRLFEARASRWESLTCIHSVHYTPCVTHGAIRYCNTLNTTEKCTVFDQNTTRLVATSGRLHGWCPIAWNRQDTSCKRICSSFQTNLFIASESEVRMITSVGPSF